MYSDIPTVIVVGAGDTVVKHFYPRLERWMKRGLINLWVSDIFPRPQAVCGRCKEGHPVSGPVPREILLCVPKTMKEYAQHWLSGDRHRPFPTIESQDEHCHRWVNGKPRPASCRNINNLHVRDAFTYLHNRADVVFVETQPQFHCATVKEWLTRARTIVVDKPFAETASEIKLLRKSLTTEEITRVWGFDHYWATAYPLKWHIGQLLSDIGGVNRIEFRMLETNGVESYRLNLPGMISDMATHLFAVLDLIGNLRSVHIDDVRRAKHYEAFEDDGGKTERESFAAIKFHLKSPWWGNGECPGIAVVGKGIGDTNDKRLIIEGPRGVIEVTFGQGSERVVTVTLLAPYNITISPPGTVATTSKSHKSVTGTKRCVAFLPDGHSKMIQCVLEGRDLDECLYSIDKAERITQLVTKARKIAKLSPLEPYNTHQSLEEVLTLTGADQFYE